MKILLVDDDRDYCDALAANLENNGCDVDKCYDGKTGLALARSTSPDVIILDIIMPDKEGIELIFEIKALRPSLPIIAISGGGRMAREFVLDMAKGVGADATVTKPFRVAEIVAVAEDLNRATA